MRLETIYFNERLELLEGVYGEERHRQLSELLWLYNRILGPVISVNLLRPELLDLSIYSAYCNHVSVDYLIRDLMIRIRPYIRSLPGGGKGANKLTALLGAFGEVTERLLGALHFITLLGHLEHATYEELTRQGRRALGPDELPLFAREQYRRPDFKYAPFQPDTFLGWVEGRELLTGNPILVPAQLVLMYYKSHEAEPVIGYATSVGGAFHTSRRQAILHGLYEVIERDGLNVHWYSRLPPARVNINLNDFLETYMDIPQVRMSTPYIRDVQVFLTTLDLPVPVMAVVALDRSRQERTFLGGSGAGSKREKALAQALFEVGQCQTAFRFDNPFARNPIYADSDLSEVTEFFDAPLYYGHAKNLPRIYWYTASKQIIPWEAVPTLSFKNEEEEYEATLEWLRTTQLKPIVLECDGACQPEVALTKVFIPQLTQACPPANPPLGHPRFYELPQKLGLADRVLEFCDLSSDPIPFV